MKRLSQFLAVFFLFIFSQVSGQVQERSQTINSSKLNGYYFEIGYKSLTVEEFATMVMEDISKPRKKRDFFELNDLKLGNVYYPEVQSYARLIEKDSIVGIWIAIDPHSIPADDESANENENEPDLNQLLQNELKVYFEGLEEGYFVFSINRQIEEAERALAYTEKRIDRLQQINNDFAEKLEYKNSELERYKALVEKTQLEVYSTEQEIVRNNQEIQKKELDLIKMRKMIEEYRSKIN